MITQQKPLFSTRLLVKWTSFFCKFQVPSHSCVRLINLSKKTTMRERHSTSHLICEGTSHLSLKTFEEYSLWPPMAQRDAEFLLKILSFTSILHKGEKDCLKI